MLALLATHLPAALSLVSGLVVDKSPKPEDVKAGWTAFAIFIALALAVAFLGWSLVRQLRKAQAAQDAGVYDRTDEKGARPPA
ncbi:MAG: hypothetical protein ACXVYW_18300 [Oryzihumus sp.]